MNDNESDSIIDDVLELKNFQEKTLDSLELITERGNLQGKANQSFLEILKKQSQTITQLFEAFSVLSNEHAKIMQRLETLEADK